MGKQQLDIHALRREAHALKPVVRVGGKGLTDAVHAEVDMALTAHELIKVKLVADKDERDAMIAELVDRAAATLVGTVGQIVILYRLAA